MFDSFIGFVICDVVCRIIASAHHFSVLSCNDLRECPIFNSISLSLSLSSNEILLVAIATKINFPPNVDLILSKYPEGSINVW